MTRNQNLQTTTTKSGVKAMLSLCLTKHYAVMMYGGVDLYFRVFLTSALVGGEWSYSRPGCFTPQKKPPVSIS
jgi:hypothetical protein